MDKYDNLMIRACKSGRSKDRIIARLLKIWRMRCALPKEYSRVNEMVEYGLIPLVEKYNPIRLSEFVRRMEPFELLGVGCPKDADAKTAALYICLSHLKLTESTKLPEYVVQVGFRRHWEKETKRLEELEKGKQII